MKKVNSIARLLFLLGIVSLCIGVVIGLINTYHWANIGVGYELFSTFFMSVVSVTFVFIIIGVILFGLSEMIEQQTLTNQLLANRSNVQLSKFHNDLIAEHMRKSNQEPTDGYHFSDSTAPPLHHTIRTKRFQNVDWYTSDSDPHWISQTIDKLGETVHTITALPQSDWYAAITSANTHLVKIDRDRTNEAIRFEWQDYPELFDWWNTYQAKQLDNK